ncbi:MAG: glycosyltransferase family 2 protein, partial [Clostridium sp.]|uniref:glycosyltransferase family 2 protein n=1 Tax=Clostridium sp. TaxID=1506 RepID=UPI00290F0B1F
MLLSIGMMVKNEEKYLDKCLASLQPILENIESELIIVDTGSEDKTVEIANKYTDKVYFHKWNNNFSEMRNKVLEYCSGEWFLCIDGDEVLENCNDIISFFKDGCYLKFNAATIYGKNVVDENNLNRTSTVETLRLFKNETGFKYIGSVHNQPTWKEPVKKLNSLLLHYGYLATDKELMERKFKRTSELLIKELEKNPNNLYYRFQLSVTYGMHGDYRKALEEAEKSYNSLINSNEDRKFYKYIYCNYVKMLMISDKYLEVEKIALEGINLTKNKTVDKIDLYYNLAKAQYNLKQSEKSIKNYNNYLEYLNLYENGE